MRELWLIRHAESEGNVTGRQDNTPLSAKGRQQAKLLGKALANTSFDLVVSSDLLRCVETAALALPGVIPQQDLKLREMQEGPKDFFLDIGKLSPEAMLQILERNAAPEAESGVAFRARVKEWIDALPDQGKILAFTHTLVIREIVRLHLAPSLHRAHHPIDNASLTRLAFETQSVKIVSINETSHLK